jgi:hypothetical protein
MRQMGWKDKLLVAGGVALLGAVVRNVHKAAQETKRRRSSPLLFDERLTQSDFSELVRNVEANTPRVTVARVEGMVVIIDVVSISGLSTWKAEIDFNDYGRLTGAYWLDSMNSDSLIPAHFAKAMQAEIKSRMTGSLPQTRTGFSSVSLAASSGSPAPPSSLPRAGWYPDPYRTARLRFWDGRAWTGYNAP